MAGLVDFAALVEQYERQQRVRGEEGEEETRRRALRAHSGDTGTAATGVGAPVASTKKKKAGFFSRIKGSVVCCVVCVAV